MDTLYEDYQWKPTGSERSEVPRIHVTRKKVMLTIFWGIDGFHIIHPTIPGKTLTAQILFHEILEPLSETLHAKSKAEPIYLHMDNCRVHTAGCVIDALPKLGFQILKHPPYSPDIAPCDFYLFSYIKAKIKGKKFSTAQDVMDEVKGVIEGISIETRRKVMEEWIERLETVQILGGEYIKGK
jgi:histone-lysine N-methyltransferase SETMAR